MKVFRYEAVDIKGNTKDGVLKANSGEEVIFKLMKCQLYPLEVQELGSHSLIAHIRLEKLKQIRDKLSPPLVQPKEESQDKPKKNLVWPAIFTIAAMLGLLICYILSR
jgi:hypothetical protein